MQPLNPCALSSRNQLLNMVLLLLQNLVVLLTYTGAAMTFLGPRPVFVISTACIPSLRNVPHIGQAFPATFITKSSSSKVPVTVIPVATFLGGVFVMPLFASRGNPHIPQ